MRSVVRLAGLCCLAAASLVLTNQSSLGQTDDGSIQNRRPSPPDERTAASLAEKARRESALRDIERRVGENAEARRRLAAEIESYRTDNASLSAAILDAARRIQSAEARMAELENRLDTLADSEAAIRTSVDNRREVIGEVLAALQRIGRRSTPALLARPEDALAAIRGSMLLGAVLPGLQEEATSLGSDLGELVRLRNLIQNDRETLAREAESSEGERRRLSALFEQRRRHLSTALSRLGDERARSEALGAEATSLRDLVDRLDADLNAARRDAAAERDRLEAERRSLRERFAAASTREPARLAPKIPFADTRGTLARPAIGQVVREFGSPDGFGGTSRGLVIAPRTRAIVTSPCDGWVAYSGPFRSFGRLLIINAGGGYNLLLAGMDQINVEAGQFVLAGEPVGQMGELGSSSAALGAVEGGGPALYVEFRKDGGPIDPQPWWAKSQGERVRG